MGRRTVAAGLGCALLLAGCSPQPVVDRLLVPPEGTPVNANAAAADTPLPTPTLLPIKPRPIAVNIARLSVKPEEQQEIDVAGTPQGYVNIIVAYSNGDHFNDGTRLGVQLDINGTYVDRWKVDPLAPGGAVSVVVQDVLTGQTDHESFLIDAKAWGGPAPSANPPLVGYVPYGTPGAGLVVLTPQPTGTPGTPSPATFATAPAGKETPTGFQVQASMGSPTVPLGGLAHVTGVLVDGSGGGVGGARLFAIGHFPSGHSEVWVSPAESGPNGLVWVEAPVTGAPSGATILVDVYMTHGGQSYHGQTSFRVA